VSLADTFTVVAWDAPGCGRSDDPPTGFSIDDYARCLERLVVALDLGRPHLVGLSFGATVALALAQLSPKLPRSLVLASAYAGWGGSLAPEEIAARVDGFLSQLELPPDKLAAQWLPSLFSADARPDVTREAGEIIRAFHPGAARTMVGAMAECDLRPGLPGVAVPTLLLYGDDDLRAPRPIAEDLHRAISGSELVFIPNAGHQVNLEQPVLFDRAVRSFLSRVAA
jgi:pimeloyl-ACP methyl ester carboxylesterase